MLLLDLIPEPARSLVFSIICLIFGICSVCFTVFFTIIIADPKALLRFAMLVPLLFAVISAFLLWYAVARFKEWRAMVHPHP